MECVMISSHLSCAIEQNGLLAWVYCDIEDRQSA